MADEQELFDNLPPSLVLLESVVLKIFNVFWLTGFSTYFPISHFHNDFMLEKSSSHSTPFLLLGYSMVLITKHVDSEYMRIMGVSLTPSL
jgi:hypothetical protein